MLFPSEDPDFLNKEGSAASSGMIVAIVACGVILLVGLSLVAAYRVNMNRMNRLR